MAPNLYLDDCRNSDLLAQLLTQARHTVVRPADAGIAWEDDEVHFRYAQGHGLVLITKNPKDFHVLHNQDPSQQETQPEAEAHYLAITDNGTG